MFKMKMTFIITIIIREKDAKILFIYLYVKYVSNILFCSKSDTILFFFSNNSSHNYCF